ncbi:excisionase family DNA-binding protein [Amycolatopsis sp. NPDC001319]|uniref:excisionase family DNA-binding protein n=1 Tax=unclassified Amycolatopsis TaxID=2618356 RepID=UPI00369674C3
MEEVTVATEVATFTTPSATGHQTRILLTVEEAAEQLSIGRTTMFALIKAGDITTVRVGRLRRVPATAVADYVDRLTSAGTAA